MTISVNEKTSVSRFPVEIGRRQVTVYPDDRDKPAEGDEFNCPAIISLLGVYPIDRSSSNGGEEVTDPDRLVEMNYDNYLRGMTRKFQGNFIDYDVDTGTWKFQVSSLRIIAFSLFNRLVFRLNISNCLEIRLICFFVWPMVKKCSSIHFLLSLFVEIKKKKKERKKET